MPINIQKIQNLKTGALGYFRFKKFDSANYLITSETGEYSFLTVAEFGDFISGKISAGAKSDELKEKGFIRTDGYKEKMAMKFAEKNHFLASGPILHIVVVTLRCNHKCLYCHASAGVEKANNLDMTLETAQKTLDAIFYTPSNNITIEFQGGEPLLNWDIVRFFIEQGRIKAQHLQKNVSFALVSNLTLMDEEKMDYLIENGINISTSLDGDELLHNENRVLKSGNSFKKVTYWIRRFNEEYEKRGLQNSFGEYLKVGALLTVTKNSLSKHKEIIDTYVGLGVNGVFLRMLNPYGFALADMKRLSYSSQDFGEFYRKSLDYILELNKDGTNFREQLSSIYLAKMLNPKDPNYLDERSPCGACIGQLAYNYDGKVYTCDEGRMLGRMGIDDFLVGKLTSDPKGDYGNLMNSEITKTMVQSSTIDGLPGYNDDVYKPYIGICPIYNYKMTGNIFSIYAKDQRRIIENSILDYLFDKIRSKDNNDIFEKWLGNDTSNLNICK